jgi:hypothetical protein
MSHAIAGTPSGMGLTNVIRATSRCFLRGYKPRVALEGPLSDFQFAQCSLKTTAAT